MTNTNQLFDPEAEFKQWAKNNKLEVLNTSLRCPAKGLGMQDVYYSLERVGVEWFVMFTFNLYRWDRKEIRERIDKSFAQSDQLRLYVKGSRYSADFWRCRNPVTNSNELKSDLDSLLKFVEPNLKQKGDSDVGVIGCKSESEFSNLMLPAGLLLDDVVKRFKSGNIDLPQVQRGKVWNAARCITLWDSILRGFSVGAVCVQYANGKYNLLDGQQRTTAICLGYAQFPPLGDEYANSVLWIDIMPARGKEAECKFHFYVTTDSQPWGYAHTADETNNERLKFAEVREALNSPQVCWHDAEKKQKPYPCELWPLRAALPVPFSLLREFIFGLDGSAENVKVGDFLKWCEMIRGRESASSLYCWNWLDHLSKDSWNQKVISDYIVKAVQDLKGYTLLVQDAGRVADDDVALYFTRIGKGGVVPTNEELAYSVLKVKLGEGSNDFREGIDHVVKELGLDRPSRVAAMVVRFCLSKSEGRLFSGDILGRVVEAVRRKEKWLVDLQDLVKARPDDRGKKTSNLTSLCRSVNVELLNEGYTNWHITRYCRHHNGVVYQFLMMVMHDEQNLYKKMVSCGLTLGGVAELLSWYAPDPLYVIRELLSCTSSFAEGFAAAMRVSYYGTPRMRLPIPVARVKDWIGKILTDEDVVASANVAYETAPELVQLAKSGYGDEASYSKLIFACNRNSKDKTGEYIDLFEYNPNMGVWSEDACPWDYDHILPHSWIDRLKKSDKAKYGWLVNSIGNLAPIDFSTNRSLSNDPRGETYPLKDSTEGVDRAQARCCIDSVDGELISSMGKDQKWYEPFYRMTLRRFLTLYRLWYSSLTSRNGGNEEREGDVWNIFSLKGNCRLIERKKTIEALFGRLQPQPKIIYAGIDEVRSEFDKMPGNDADWYVWMYIGLALDKGVEVWIDRDGKWEVGIRKDGEYERRGSTRQLEDDVNMILGEISDVQRRIRS